MNDNLQDALLMLVNSSLITMKELSRLCNSTDQEVFLAIRKIQEETIFRTSEKVRLSRYVNRYLHEKNAKESA